jgi:hypothetical protein
MENIDPSVRGNEKGTEWLQIVLPYFEFKLLAAIGKKPYHEARIRLQV